MRRRCAEDSVRPVFASYDSGGVTLEKRLGVTVIVSPPPPSGVNSMRTTDFGVCLHVAVTGLDTLQRRYLWLTEVPTTHLQPFNIVYYTDALQTRVYNK